MKKKQHSKLMKILGLILITISIGIIAFTIGKQLGEPKMQTTTVIIETTKGTIETEVYNDLTPITTTNFLDLVNKQFYDGLTFHRYVEGFVIQGGDPRGDGTGGSGNNIQLEIADELQHEQGVLAMARSADPNSASSQFYITLEAAPHLDGSYAIFGKVTKGMDIVLQLREGDVMNKVYVK